MDLEDDLLLSQAHRDKQHVYSFAFTRRLIDLLKEYENDAQFKRNQNVTPRLPVIDREKQIYSAWIATPSELELDYIIAYLVWKHDLLMLSGVVKLALPPGYGVPAEVVEKRLAENDTEFHLSVLRILNRSDEGTFSVSIDRESEKTTVNRFYQQIINDQNANVVELAKLKERDADVEGSLSAFSLSMQGSGPLKRSYGVDIVASLTTEQDAKGLRLFDFNNPLTDVCGEICGVTTSNDYIARNNTYFAVHLEDGRVYSISYNMLGFAKTWAVIPPAYSPDFERLCNGIFKAEREECMDYLASHKVNLIPVDVIRQAKVPLVIENCHEGEVIITAPGAYHLGHNNGVSVAEATNFATCLFFNQEFFDADIGCAEVVNTVVMDKEQIYDNCERLGMFDPANKPVFPNNTYRKGIFKYLVAMFNAYVIRQMEISGAVLTRDSGCEPFVPLFNFDDSPSRETRYAPLLAVAEPRSETMLKKRSDWEPMKVFFHIVVGMERHIASPLSQKFARDFWRLIWEPTIAEKNPAKPAAIAERLQKMFFKDSGNDFNAEQMDQQLRKGHFYHPFMAFIYFRTVIQIRSLKQRGDATKKYDKIIALYNRILYPCVAHEIIDDAELSSSEIIIILSDMYEFAPFVQNTSEIFHVMLPKPYAEVFEMHKAELFGKLVSGPAAATRSASKQTRCVQLPPSTPNPVRVVSTLQTNSAQKPMPSSVSSSSSSPLSAASSPGGEFWPEVVIPVHKRQKCYNLYKC